MEQFAREKLPPDETADSTSAITLGECLELYASMQEEARRLDDLVQTLRQQILEVMAEHDLQSIRHGAIEAVRVATRRAPSLDLPKAVKLLETYDRLQECFVERIDETNVAQVIAELASAGKIAEGDLPYRVAAGEESLVIRSVSAPEKSER